MRLFDTHAHYYNDVFDADRDAILSGLPDRGIEARGDKRTVPLFSSCLQRNLSILSLCFIAMFCLSSCGLMNDFYLPKQQEAQSNFRPETSQADNPHIEASMCPQDQPEKTNDAYTIKNIPVENLLSSLEKNTYLVAVAHPIELSFLAEEGQNSGTTTELSLMYEKYKNLWQEEVIKYQSLIDSEISMSVEDPNAFRESMNLWEESLKGDIDFFSQMEIALHSYGSIVSVNISRFTMEQYRAKALQLIAMYDEIMVGRGWSWKNQELQLSQTDSSSVSSD